MPAHRVELSAQDMVVAVGLVHGPGHDRGRIGPAGSPEARLAIDDDVRHDGGHAQLVVLVEGDIAKPRRPEGLRVEERRTGRREGLGVSGPAQALVALRAVGRNGDEVVALRPDDVLKESVEHGVTAAERGPSRRVAADGNERCVEDLGIRLDLRVAKAVEGVARLEERLVVVGKHVRVGGPRRAERDRVERAIRLQDLGVADADP